METKNRTRIQPALLVHGGAWKIPTEMHQDSIRGCREAARIGWNILKNGGSALDAVEAAVRNLEDDPTFDAGRGSVLNAAGEVELDAIIMDGKTLDLGAVMAVKQVSNPIALARLVMEKSNHTVLVSGGAEKFALNQGMSPCPNWDLIVRRERARWRSRDSAEDRGESPFPQHPGGTVGAVALDVDGHLAAATSTGGTFNKHPGRVGDSPLVGSGAYADDWSGAVSATGEGEDLMKVVISKLVCDSLSRMPAQDAAEMAIALLTERTGGQGGLIVLGKNGDAGIAHCTRYLAHAYVTSEGEIFADIQV